MTSTAVQLCEAWVMKTSDWNKSQDADILYLHTFVVDTLTEGTVDRLNYMQQIV